MQMPESCVFLNNLWQNFAVEIVRGELKWEMKWAWETDIFVAGMAGDREIHTGNIYVCRFFFKLALL